MALGAQGDLTALARPQQRIPEHCRFAQLTDGPALAAGVRIVADRHAVPPSTATLAHDSAPSHPADAAGDFQPPLATAPQAALALAQVRTGSEQRAAAAPGAVDANTGTCASGRCLGAAPQRECEVCERLLPAAAFMSIGAAACRECEASVERGASALGADYARWRWHCWEVHGTLCPYVLFPAHVHARLVSHDEAWYWAGMSQQERLASSAARHAALQECAAAEAPLAAPGQPAHSWMYATAESCRDTGSVTLAQGGCSIAAAQAGATRRSGGASHMLHERLAAVDAPEAPLPAALPGTTALWEGTQGGAAQPATDQRTVSLTRGLASSLGAVAAAPQLAPTPHQRVSPSRCSSVPEVTAAVDTSMQSAGFGGNTTGVLAGAMHGDTSAPAACAPCLGTAGLQNQAQKRPRSVSLSPQPSAKDRPRRATAGRGRLLFNPCTEVAGAQSERSSRCSPMLSRACSHCRVAERQSST